MAVAYWRVNTQGSPGHSKHHSKGSSQMLVFTGLQGKTNSGLSSTHMCVCVLMGVTAGHRSWFPDLSNGYNAGEGLAGIAVTICVPASRRSQMGVPGVKPTTL